MWQRLDQHVEHSFVEVPGGRLAVTAQGCGEPVVFVQTALVADELALVATARAVTGHHRILYHRRGYGDSSPARAGQSIRDDAEDCLHLLHALRLPRAHVVGLSYAGAVALQLATDHPSAVHTLTLVEPPPVHVASAGEFRAATTELLQVRGEHGPAIALDRFMTMLTGPEWRADTERELPGAAAQMDHDAATFFDTDIPALLSWQYSTVDAARVSCPILHVGGTDSGSWFAQVREQVLTWFPDAEDVVIESADHTLALSHPEQIADALVAFLARHPLRAAPEPTTARADCDD